jgi:hypothetical protein
MIPVEDRCVVYVNRLMVAHLFRSDGRPRSKKLGFAMWSYNGQPLGWIEDGGYYCELVTAALQLEGQLAPRWESLQTGMRLIHPRYTLTVEKTANGWRPSIVDDLLGTSHSFAPRRTMIEAANLLDNLLRRRVGREKPSLELDRPGAGFYECTTELQLAFSSGLLNFSGLIRDEAIKPYHWSEIWKNASVVKLVKSLDDYSYPSLDPLLLLATTLATYIKSALIDVYRGANSITPVPGSTALTFSAEELAAFRDRFRRSPMTDDEYINLINQHFVTPIRPVRRKHRVAKSSTSYLRPLRPRRDAGDYPFGWPFPTSKRPFEVEQRQQTLNLAA